MNKYLMLSAAALLASAASATAATYTFGFVTVGGNSLCDSGILTTQDNGVRRATWKDTNDNCTYGTSEGLGLLTNVKGLGKVYTVSDTVLGKYYGTFGQQISWALPAKPRNGAPWTMWVSTDGVSSFEFRSGVLIDVGTGKTHIRGTGAKSIASVVRQMLVARGRIAK